MPLRGGAVNYEERAQPWPSGFTKTGPFEKPSSISEAVAIATRGEAKTPLIPAGTADGMALSTIAMLRLGAPPASGATMYVNARFAPAGHPLLTALPMGRLRV